MISFQNVSLQYVPEVGVQDISFNIHPNEFAFLIGPTGSGKSTILKLIYMELFPDSGTMEILEFSSEKIKKFRVEIENIENRLLLFDSSLEHHSTSCTNVKCRLNININYIFCKG